MSGELRRIRATVLEWSARQHGLWRDGELLPLLLDERETEISEALAWPECASGIDRLAPVEAAIGIPSQGSEAARIGAAAKSIELKVTAWERMRPKELLEEREAIAAVHNLLERMFFDGEPMPGEWWERLVYRMGRGVFERCYSQARRCHKAVVTREYGREERAIGAMKGGANEKRKARAQTRHGEWVVAARKLIAAGRDARNVSAMIATRYGYSTRQVRVALQKAGIVPYKKREVN